MGRIHDHCVMTGIGRLCAGQNGRHACKKRMTDIDRVLGNVKIADGCAFEVVVEHEVVLPTAAENCDAVTDVDEGVVSSRATHYLEVGHIGRRASTDEVY